MRRLPHLKPPRPSLANEELMAARMEAGSNEVLERRFLDQAQQTQQLLEVSAPR